MLVLSQRVLNKPTCFRSVRLQKLRSLCTPTKEWGEKRQTPETAYTIAAPDTEAAAVDANGEESVKKELTGVVDDEVMMFPSQSSMNQGGVNTNEVTAGTLEEEAELPPVVE